MTRIGDPLSEEELNQFFNLIDNGTEYVSLSDVTNLLNPQTTKDLYSKDIPKNVNQ